MEKLVWISLTNAQTGEQWTLALANDKMVMPGIFHIVNANEATISSLPLIKSQLFDHWKRNMPIKPNQTTTEIPFHPTTAADDDVSS